LDFPKEFNFFPYICGIIKKKYQMKNYLVTLLGDFESDELCQEIVLALSPIMDSETVKIKRLPGVLMMYFASDMGTFELHVSFKIFSKDTGLSFILSEHTDNMSVFLNGDDEFDFLNLSNNQGSDLELIPKQGFQYIDNINEEEFVALLLNEVKKNVVTPSLDELLEKVKEGGIGALSPFEKGVLESYSK
jgi:hypothetical protein